MPMERFKNGIKRLLVSGAPADAAAAPFAVLARDRNGAATETWLVRGWEPAMTTWFDSHGASVQSIVDLDLEDGFVELLRTFRGPRGREAS
jgi:hypothetical protein